MLRTHTCGELRLSDVGKEVTLSGWLQKSRDIGTIGFIDLRDRYGITQLSFDEGRDKSVFEKARTLGREYVLRITGTVIERTAKHFQVSIDEITGPKRDKDIVVPRQVAMYLLRSELHLSFPKIAKELGRKDHTTAIHSVEKIEKESTIDTTIKSAISDIKERLYA